MFKAGGFTIIEVLVSIFVLALGVMGVAGMQLHAMRASHLSGYQTTAVQMAAALADKMRANAVSMRKTGANNPFLFTYQASDSVSENDGATTCYGAAECNAAEMAVFDINEWQQRLNASLPGARAAVCHDSTPVGEGASKHLTWECDASAGGVNAPIVIKIGWEGRGKNPDGSSNTGGEYPPSVAVTVEPYVNPVQ